MKYPVAISLLVVSLAACGPEHDAGSSFIIETAGSWQGTSGASGHDTDQGGADSGGASGASEEGGSGPGGSDAQAGHAPHGGAAGNGVAGEGAGGDDGGAGDGAAGDDGESGAGGADEGAGGASGQANGGSAGGGKAGSGAGAGGKAGSGGAGGKAGAGGSGGKAGASGAAGKGGTSGGGSSGSSGQSGAGGKAGAGGNAGASGGGGGGGECPPEMVPVAEGGFCVDRWEAQVEVLTGGAWTLHSPFDTLDDITAPTRAVSSPGVVPQGYIAGHQAREACEGAGKRLCARTEYRQACRGPDETTYPYGDTYEPKVCNEGRKPHPIVQLFGSGPDAFSSAHMNDPAVNQLPDSLAATGDHAACVSGYGAFDMVGNLHEWVDEDDGTFCGGFYVDAEINGHGCLYTTTAHNFTYHDYSTGFRCCLTP